VLPWLTYTGTKLETVDTDKVNLQLTKTSSTRRRQRPLGVAALEDKLVQQAVATILNQIYEEDFLGFSYGFRPGRSQHDALDALSYALLKKKVNYVLDADIRGFSITSITVG